LGDEVPGRVGWKTSLFRRFYGFSMRKRGVLLHRMSLLFGSDAPSPGPSFLEIPPCRDCMMRPPRVWHRSFLMGDDIRRSVDSLHRREFKESLPTRERD
jgi:hypothetical protein